MLDEQTARTLVEQAVPGSKAVACVQYRKLYLVRVQRADPDEEDYDPFFSVDFSTREVSEFSVITDGDIVEISNLFDSA